MGFGDVSEDAGRGNARGRGAAVEKYPQEIFARRFGDDDAEARSDADTARGDAPECPQLLSIAFTNTKVE
jgi:hypothetical protein